jgi:hypothetical protein
LNGKVVGPRKPRLTAMGIRCADHTTPSIRKSFHLLCQHVAVTRSVEFTYRLKLRSFVFLLIMFVSYTFIPTVIFVCEQNIIVKCSALMLHIWSVPYSTLSRRLTILIEILFVLILLRKILC